MTALEKLLKQAGLLDAMQCASKSVNMSVDELMARCADLVELARPELKFDTDHYMAMAGRWDARQRRALRGCRNKIPKGSEVFILIVEVDPTVCSKTFVAVNEMCEFGATLGLPLVSCPGACDGNIADIFLIGRQANIVDKLKQLCEEMGPAVMTLRLECADTAFTLANFRYADGVCYTKSVTEAWRVLGDPSPTDLSKVGTLACRALESCRTKETPALTGEQKKQLQEFMGGKTKDVRNMRLS